MSNVDPNRTAVGDRTDVVRFLPDAEREGAPMRVLFVTNMWPDEVRPYYGTFIHSQGQSLRAAGVQVDVLYVRGYLTNKAYLRAAAAIPSRAGARPYDVVHIHYGHTFAAGAFTRRRPLIVSFCGEDLLGAPRENGISRKSRFEVSVFRQLARVATRTITKSEEMERALPEGLRARNHVLPNGVDVERFAPRPRDEARRTLGWDVEGTVLLFLGNPDDPRKNVALARETAEIVRANRPDVRLEIGWQIKPDDVPIVMNAADCMVFTSKSEGSPNAVKEAMASALPIVSTAVGDVPERFSGVDGCYVCDDVPEAFAHAVMRALEQGLAPAAREAVMPLAIGMVADRLIEIYERAMVR